MRRLVPFCALGLLFACAKESSQPDGFMTSESSTSADDGDGATGTGMDAGDADGWKRARRQALEIADREEALFSSLAQGAPRGSLQT